MDVQNVTVFAIFSEEGVMLSPVEAWWAGLWALPFDGGYPWRLTLMSLRA